jgi:recombination protein RecR
LNIIEKLISGLSRLPGLGRKSASRIVYYFLKNSEISVEQLAKDLLELKRTVKICINCGNYTDVQPCSLCTDSSRDNTLLCVVEEPKDILSIESTGAFNGLYHVLMGSISPINGIGPESLRINDLLQRIEKLSVQEIILATNPTVEGDTTALYLLELLKKRTGLKITRLALGLPVGGDLEYADKLTLARALKGRAPIY